MAASLRNVRLKANDMSQAEVISHPEPAGVAVMALAAQDAALESSHPELEHGVSACGVPYVVGGWSSQARCRLAMQAADFSVTLVFAHRGSCEYVADVDVRVCNEHGEEIAVLHEAGPIVLLGLAPGSYEIAVRRNGHVLNRTVTVGPRTRRQTVFYWSAPDPR